MKIDLNIDDLELIIENKINLLMWTVIKIDLIDKINLDE